MIMSSGRKGNEGENDSGIQWSTSSEIHLFLGNIG